MHRPLTSNYDSLRQTRQLFRQFFLVVFGAAASASCAQPEVIARFDADRPQSQVSCINRLFPIEATFAANRKRIDSAGLFWATDTSPTYDKDLVYLEVFDREAARNSSNDPIAFDYVPDTATQPMRMEVHPEGSCPDNNLSLVVEGAISFTRFGQEPGDRVTGRLVSGTLLNARTGDVVAESITGNWDFTVEAGFPNQYFPTYDSDEYRRNP